MTRERATLPLLVMAMALSLPHETSIAPFLNEIAEEFDRSTGVIGQLGTATFLGGVIAALAIMPSISQFSLRSAIAVTLGIVAITSIVSGMVTSFELFLLVRILAGAALGVLAGSAVAAVARAWTEPEVRTRNVGYVIAGTAIGVIALGPLLRSIGGRTDWQTAQLVYGAIAGVATLLVLVGLPVFRGMPTTSPYRSKIVAAAGALVLPVVRLALLFRLVVMVVFGTMFGYLAGFLVDTYTNGDDWIAATLVMAPIGFMVTLFGGPRFVAMLGTSRGAMYGAVGTSIVLLAYAWITPTPAFTAAMFFCYGLALGLMQVAINSLLFEHAGDRRDAAVFANGALGVGGSLLGNLIGGVAIVGFGYLGWQVFLTISVLVMLAVGTSASWSAHAANLRAAEAVH